MITTKHTIQKKHLRILFILLPVIGIISNLLPFLPGYVLNKLLGNRNGHRGGVSRLSFSFLGKSLTLHEFFLNKKTPHAGIESKLVSASSAKIVIDRAALWQGFLIITATVDKFFFVYFRQAENENAQNGSPVNLSSLLNLQVPFVIRDLLITNSELEYVDYKSAPLVDLYMNNLRISAENLSNTPDPERALPSKITISAKICGGLLNAQIQSDLSQAQPAFDINADLQGVDLKQLNNFFRAYGNFDVNNGTLSLFTEVASKDNRFKGYVKPEIFDLDVAGPEDRNKTMLNRLWEDLIGAVAVVFENHKNNELATKIPFSGTFKRPHANLLFAVAEVLNNAFVHALKPSIDYEINIHSVDKK